MTKVEYRVRPVTRYIITRHFEDEAGKSGTHQKGEYDNPEVAHEVATALCRQEHYEVLRYPPGDERVRYPERDEQAPMAFRAGTLYVRDVKVSHRRPTVW